MDFHGSLIKIRTSFEVLKILAWFCFWLNLCQITVCHPPSLPVFSSLPFPSPPPYSSPPPLLPPYQVTSGHSVFPCQRVTSSPANHCSEVSVTVRPSTQFGRSVVSDSLRPHGLRLWSPVHHQLPEFAQTPVHWVSDAIQLSHPLSSPSPPTFNLSQHQGLFKRQFFASGGQSTGVSATVRP